MKSEVKTNLTRRRRPEEFSLLWPRRTTVRSRCVACVCVTPWGLQLGGSRYLRGFTRPCVSVNALRHTWGTGNSLCTSAKLLVLCFFLRALFFCCFCGSGPWSLGSYRARGPASYGDCRCVHPSRTFGSLPASRI